MIHWSELEVEFDPVTHEPISGEIVFSHVDDKTNEVRHFAVERIERRLKTMDVLPPVIEIPIDPIFAVFAIRARGVEQHRLERVTPQDICNYPIMLARIPEVGRDSAEIDGLIIDGIHRYVKAAMMGWKSIRAYLMEREFWEEYLIDIPEIEEDTRRKMEGQAKGVPIDSRIP